MSGDLKLPTRPQPGTVKINDSDSVGRYLESIIGNGLKIENSLLQLDVSAIDVETGNWRPAKLVFNEDIINNMHKIWYKDSVDSTTYIYAEFSYTNLIGASILNQIVIDDFTKNERTTLVYSYENDYKDIEINKTVIDIS